MEGDTFEATEWDGSAPLRGLVDLSKIDRVLSGMVQRLEAQERKILILEEQRGQHEGNTEQLATIRDGVDRALEAIEKRFGDLEMRIESVEQSNAVISEVKNRVDEIQAKLVQCALDVDVNNGKEEVIEFICRLNEEMRRVKADADKVDKLESAHGQLLNEVVALQSLTACKVDRVEIPLLRASSDKLRELLAFKADAVPRIERLETNVDEAYSVLELKEDKEKMVKRMQIIHRQLEDRVLKEWTTEQVVAPLQELQKKMELVQCDLALFEDNEVIASVRSLRNDLVQLKDLACSIRERIELIEGSADERVSVRMLEGKADRPYCEQLVQDALKSGDSKHRELLQIAQTLRDDIVELRAVQNAVEDKLSVCMRFMSWYSDMHDRTRSGM